MKKKLATLLCAAMLTCALPALAWADESAAPVDGGSAPAANTLPAKWVSAQAESDGVQVKAEATVGAMSIDPASDPVDASLSGMPSFNLVVTDGKEGVVFYVTLSDKYLDCDKLEVHVRPNGTSAGKASTFTLDRSGTGSFPFMSSLFGVYAVSSGVYQGDFTMTFVPKAKDADQPAPPAADTPASDEPADKAPSAVDTGSKSPQTGLGLGDVAGASAAMLVAAGGVALALRKKLAC